MARTNTKRKPTSEQLSMLMAQAVEKASEPRAARPPTIPPAPETFPSVYADEAAIPKLAFGAWLVRQDRHPREWIASLARVAKSDPGFPKKGSPDAARQHLLARGADGDMFEALDDAELDWLSL